MDSATLTVHWGWSRDAGAVCPTMQRRQVQTAEIQAFTSTKRKTSSVTVYVSPCAFLTSKGQTAYKEQHDNKKNPWYVLYQSHHDSFTLAFTTKWLLNLTPYFDTLLMEKEFLTKSLPQVDLSLSKYVKMDTHKLHPGCNTKTQ